MTNSMRKVGYEEHIVEIALTWQDDGLGTGDGPQDMGN